LAVATVNQRDRATAFAWRVLLQWLQSNEHTMMGHELHRSGSFWSVLLLIDYDCIWERLQQIANHEFLETTKLYDRTEDQITLDEVERIVA
jgi:hypothetical protein